MADVRPHLANKSTIDRITLLLLGIVRVLMSLLSRLSPALAGRWGERLFRTVRRHPTPPRERRWLADARPIALTLGEQRLAAWSWGDGGPTVLLVHGWEGRGAQLGAFVAPLRAQGHRVVTFDAPGHGSSPGRRSSLAAFAAAVAAAGERLGPLHAVVAHSFGAAGTAWALASGRISAERLVFIAAPADLEDYIRLFSRLVGLSDAGREAMLRRLEARVGIDWERARRVTTRPAEGVRMLVVHDHDDRESPFANGGAIAGAWPGSRLLATSGLGHFRILRDPRVVDEAVRFLAPAGRATAEAAERDEVRSAAWGAR